MLRGSADLLNWKSTDEMEIKAGTWLEQLNNQVIKEVHPVCVDGLTDTLLSIHGCDMINAVW